MKEVISLEELPFDIPNFMKNKDITIKKMSSPVINKDYYYISSSSIYMVYSYEILKNYKHVQLIAELTVHDVYEAIDLNPEFKAKVKAYVGN
jgi:hypothetical protein